MPQVMIVSFITALLIQFTITWKYLKNGETFKFIAYTTLYNIPVAFAVNALITYIRG